KALALDPRLAEAWTSLACVRLRFDWDWTGAERAFRRALELRPGYATAHQWYGEFLGMMGRYDEALAEVGAAEEHDPFSLIIRVARASIHYFGRRYDAAIEECRNVLEMDPGFLPAHQYLVAAYEQKGMFAEAESAAQRAGLRTGAHAASIAALRNAHALAGIQGAERGRLEELAQHSRPGRDPSYIVAAIYAAL